MAEDKELENVKRLSPEERIRRLREIARKDEEEIKKAQEMIKDSEEELEEEEKSKRQIPIPQLRSIDVSTLFGKGTQEEVMFRAKRFVEAPAREEEEGVEATVETGARGRELEEIAARERTRREAEEEAIRQYTSQAVRYEPIRRARERVEEIQSGLYSSGTTREEKERLLGELGAIRMGTAQKLSDIEDGSYASDASNQAVLTYKAAKQLMDKYKA